MRIFKSKLTDFRKICLQSLRSAFTKLESAYRIWKHTIFYMYVVLIMIYCGDREKEKKLIGFWSTYYIHCQHCLHYGNRIILLKLPIFYIFYKFCCSYLYNVPRVFAFNIEIDRFRTLW